MLPTAPRGQGATPAEPMSPFHRLDPATLQLSIALFGAMLAALSFAMARAIDGHRAVLRRWGWAMNFAALSFAAFFFAGDASAWPAQLIATPISLGMPVYGLLAHARLQCLRVHPGPLLAITAAAMSGPLAAYFGGAPMWVAVTSASLACAVLSARTAWIIARLPRTKRSTASWMSLCAFGALAAMLTLRALLSAFGDDALPMESNAAPQVVSLFIGGVFIVCSTLGIVLMAVENQRQHALEGARRDALTGVLTRGAFVEAAQRQLQAGGAVGLLMIDLDHFKRINDSLGHAAGDRVLAYAARLVAKRCRATDLVGRYGGEEFCVLMPGGDPRSVMDLAQRLVHDARDAVLQHERGACRYTLSVGFATRDAADAAPCADNSAAAVLATLFDAADRALYAAKRSGRDRAVASAALTTDAASADATADADAAATPRATSPLAATPLKPATSD